MGRTNTKIGDVFSVKINDNHKKYFQLIAFDSTQLNSDVIRAFKRVYSMEEIPDLSVIINDEVDFYSHCVTKFGLKMGLWEVVGNISEVGDFSNVIFRDTNDYGTRPGIDPIKISHNWHVWRINDRNFTLVGKLEGENRNSFIGLVMNPVAIVEMLKGNTYLTNYPNYE
jgi:hypothetical protein